jgi:modulator of FtsH protease HflK
MAHRKPKMPDFIDLGDGNIQLPINPRWIVLGVLFVLAALWVLRGGPVYTIKPEEEGVVLTFGKYTRSTPPGLHFKFPWPIQAVEKVTVDELRRMEFGFRTVRQGQYRDASNDVSMLEEAQMLTGDENVVNCSMAAQYRIRDAVDYLFNYLTSQDVNDALQDVGEAALRQAVGDHPIDHVLTTRKQEIQSEIRDKMQEMADRYAMGVTIVEVQLQNVQPPMEVNSAFKDVASAREERERIINQAEAYEREKLPLAEGEAARVIAEADGYREARIAEAQGSVARFKAIAGEYAQAPDITRARLYLDAMEDLLPHVRVTVVDPEVGVVNLKSLGMDAPPPVPRVTDEERRRSMEGPPRVTDEERRRSTP